MTEQVRQKLERGAGTPPAAPDLDDLWRRGRRQRRLAQAAAGGAALALIAAAAIVVPELAGWPGPSVPVIDQPGGDSESTAPDDEQPDEPADDDEGSDALTMDEQLAENPPDPPDPEPAGPMEVEPNEASPGDTLALTFPEEDVRGLNWVLQEPADGDAWRDVAYLFSDHGGSGPPLSILVEDVPENFSFTDPGGGGPGPDHVVLPSELEAGTYRICEEPGGTANEPMCVRITVR